MGEDDEVPGKVPGKGAAEAGLAAVAGWPTMTVRKVPLEDRSARVRLESAIWDGLDEIASQQRRPVKQLCRELAAGSQNGATISSTIRTYVLDYFRRAK